MLHIILLSISIANVQPLDLWDPQFYWLICKKAMEMYSDWTA